MSAEVSCPSCHHRAVWTEQDGVIGVQTVLQEGGARAPTGPPDLTAWHTWRASRASELGPVVGRCPQCAQPLVAESGTLPPADAWTLQAKEHAVVVSQAALTLDGSPAADDVVDALMQRELGARFTDQLDGRLFFVAVLLLIIGFVGTAWLAAAFFVVNFYLAMSTQGNFSAPFTP